MGPESTRRVEFADTDAAGIAHFSAFFAWMEETEHEFLRSRGLSVSEYLRRAVLARPIRAKRARARFKPGRVVIKGATDAPTLTSADVAVALYE